jgi:hypothetical protein
LEKCGFKVVGEDRFISEVFGRNLEEYILTLDGNPSERPE